MTAFPLPHPVQLRGSRLASAVLKAAGWELQFEGLPKLQGVFVVYPHTSNWDLLIAVLAKWALGVQVNFWGKDSLFKIPVLGHWLRWIGGIPAARNVPGGLVGQAVAGLQEAQRTQRYCWMGLSPEGTRKRTAGWRSGFYQTALQARVPLCLVLLDYSTRRVGATHFYWLSGDEPADVAHIAASFVGAQGYRPQEASPIVLLKSVSASPPPPTPTPQNSPAKPPNSLAP